jgi:hypothetical protein
MYVPEKSHMASETEVRLYVGKPSELGWHEKQTTRIAIVLAFWPISNNDILIGLVPVKSCGIVAF